MSINGIGSQQNYEINKVSQQKDPFAKNNDIAKGLQDAVNPKSIFDTIKEKLGFGDDNKEEKAAGTNIDFENC